MATHIFTAIINSYCRALTNWSCYEGIPKYDTALAEYITATGYQLHMRLDFSSTGSEVFIPLRYFSESGGHVFDFPAAERELAADKLTIIDAARFLTTVKERLEQGDFAAELGL